jgi:hypothetical protein
MRGPLYPVGLLARGLDPFLLDLLYQRLEFFRHDRLLSVS